ncbi:hypothetical protein SynPROS91_02359 [Synechococcus sp. PROS-9-1]|nr:hypothetical protein SynPROS91_02359 [Synechococcus sp. PROS-9-1]
MAGTKIAERTVEVTIRWVLFMQSFWGNVPHGEFRIEPLFASEVATD